MNRKYRKTFIIGNWKMNLTPSQAKDFLQEFKTMVPKERICNIGLCVPAISIPVAVRVMHDTRVGIGAQNCHQELSGAYTGEISCPMLKDADCKFVIIGHSERRAAGETNDQVNAKVLTAITCGLMPIVCCGESLKQRETNVIEEHLAIQIKTAFSGIPEEKAHKVIIAYEPIWAIGTGKTATPEQAEETCAFIRRVIRKLYSAKTARAISILYGGSMNDLNAHELLVQPDIDGGLIGGASLDPQKFKKIIDATK